MPIHDTDIAIIGAGILGLSHAYAAARRGLRVTVFERSEQPLGASVRNFGQALITGQAPGPMLDLAREARPIWAHLAESAGFHIRRQGSLLFARDEAEEQVLDAFCAGRARSTATPSSCCAANAWRHCTTAASSTTALRCTVPMTSSCTPARRCRPWWPTCVTRWV